MGRQEELAALCEVVGASRVLTLTGPPGVGKTRLGLEVTLRLAPDLGPAHFVDLSAVSDPARVPEQVAAALGLREETARPLPETVASHVGEQAVVLVLDNCEHVVEGAAEVVSELMRRCPNLRVVATSQERLRIEGERVSDVAPLSLPPSTEPEEVLGSEAVQLFCERAQVVRPGFALTPASAVAVSEICRHLDGLPLAIELAAALMGVSSPEVVAAALDERFALLRSGDRSGPARHQTLVGALEWSYALLEPAEQALLRRISVFAGGASADAVWQVCADEDVGRGAVLGLLTRLVERSLVVVDPTADDPRYHLLESICRFAADMLAEAGESETYRDRHLAWVSALSKAAADKFEGGSSVPEWLAAENHNIRAALEWATARGHTEAALRVAGTYLVLCRRGRRYREAREWAERVLSLPARTGDYGPRVQRLLDAASLAAVAGDFDAASARAEEALDRLEKHADSRDHAEVLAMVGFFSLFVGPPDTALETLERSVNLARASGDAAALGEALSSSGRARMFVGDVHRARGYFGEALAVAAGEAEKVPESEAHIGLGWAALTMGEYETARSHLGEALSLADSLGANHLRAVGAVWAGELARLEGDYDQARGRFHLALEVGRAIETPYPSVRALTGLGWVSYAEGDMDAAEEHFQEALTMARRAANGYLIGPALEGLGAVAQARGDQDHASGMLEEALAVARQRHDRVTEGAVHHQLGRLARSGGDVGGAVSAHHEALALRAEVGHRPGVVDTLEALGGLAVAAGRTAHGVRLMGAAQALRERHGYRRSPSDQATYQADVDAARNALSAEEFDRAWADGAALDAEQAVAYARRGRGQQGRPSTGWAALTAAERQVAELVARGLTNAQIAERLFVSPRTVQAHLRNIFTKLNVRTRAAVASEAQRH